MRFEVSRGRIATQLMRSGLGPKLLLTIGLILVLGLSAWLISQKLDQKRGHLQQQVASLQDQLTLQDHVLVEYQQLQEQERERIAQKNPLHGFTQQQLDQILKLVNQAGLKLQLINSQSLELIGEYSALQFFLSRVHTLSESFDCRELKILQNGDRLQITYVYGIHTLVSK